MTERTVESRAQHGRSVQPALSGRGRIDYSIFVIVGTVSLLVLAGWAILITAAASASSPARR